MNRYAMNRCWGCLSILWCVVVLAGCAEESLDVPILLDDDAATESAADVESMEIVHPAPWLGEEPSTEAAQPCAVKSVWNALLNGAAQALDESAAP